MLKYKNKLNARNLSIWINGKKENLWERSEGNEIQTVELYADNIKLVEIGFNSSPSDNSSSKKGCINTHCIHKQDNNKCDFDNEKSFYYCFDRISSPS